jgi:ABC-type polysaccharide/polyol phosphate transport system ATPase subunit
MNENIVIELKDIDKRFKRGRKLLLKEALVDMFKPNPTEWFWALKGIDLTINKGETVGIIGRNGSGKSTVLKLISGFMTPDKGTVVVNGKVSPLIELGAGFHPELTGAENLVLNGVILGLTRKEVDERFNSIVDFAEIRDFINTPVKHYSSGMYMRLGFSIAIHTNPDILLIDEILAVGDTSFQKKSFVKMQEFKEKGATIVFVSHNLDTVGKFCDRVIYLKNARIMGDGEPKQIIAKYKKDQR